MPSIARRSARTLWLDRRLADDGTTLRAQYDVDSIWIDEDDARGDPFLVAQSASLALHKPWAQWGTSVVTAAFESNFFDFGRFDVPDFLAINPDDCEDGVGVCGPQGLNENDVTDRSGEGVLASVAHTVPLPPPNRLSSLFGEAASLRGEYSYFQYWSEGSEYDHRRHRISLGMDVSLAWQFRLAFGGSYAYRRYARARSVFPDPDLLVPTPPSTDVAYDFEDLNQRRREQEAAGWVTISRPIIDGLVAEASYRYVDNNSAVQVFDYDRHVVGFVLRAALGR